MSVLIIFIKLCGRYRPQTPPPHLISKLGHFVQGRVIAPLDSVKNFAFFRFLLAIIKNSQLNITKLLHFRFTRVIMRA